MSVEFIKTSISSRRLVVAARHEFARSCLVSWLGSLNLAFDIFSVASIENAQLPEAIGIILCESDHVMFDRWITGQVRASRASGSTAPIFLVVEPDNMRAAEDIVVELGLQGYIPTSSTVEVAAAAIHLILAGGVYVPRVPTAHGPDQAVAGRNAMGPNGTGKPRLTPREQAVLNLLERGLQNKIIACRLGMSQSTVKAHVHNIIAKMKVANRTEAAVAVHIAQIARVEPEVVAAVSIAEITQECQVAISPLAR